MPRAAKTRPAPAAAAAAVAVRSPRKRDDEVVAAAASVFYERGPVRLRLHAGVSGDGPFG